MLEALDLTGNPSSVHAAGRSARRLLEAARARVAACLDAMPADLVFTCGPWMKVLFDSLPRSKQGAHAQDAASLAPLVKSALRAGDTLLVKGSYGSRMRDVISHLESPA